MSTTCPFRGQRPSMRATADCSSTTHTPLATSIQQVQRPTLVMAHNKTLAAQLYGEFKEFFPENSVEYFVSYYDYYQPEAYVPSSDTYIEKDASINEHIEQMRLSATKALLERPTPSSWRRCRLSTAWVIPASYHAMILHLNRGELMDQRRLLRRLADMQYTRNEMDLQAGTYRVRGDVIDIFPAESAREAVRVELFDETIESLAHVRSADRRDPAQAAALHGVPGLALRDAEGTPHRRHRLHPRGTARPAQGAARAEQAGGGAAPRAAHHVRHGDDERGRLLLRHRELLALSVRPRSRASRHRACSTICRRMRC